MKPKLEKIISDKLAETLKDEDLELSEYVADKVLDELADRIVEELEENGFIDELADRIVKSVITVDGKTVWK